MPVRTEHYCFDENTIGTYKKVILISWFVCLLAGLREKLGYW